jgi:Response regulators consisting of a CheY-like receiver domain and a winged-helix DNA-binding domain
MTHSILIVDDNPAIVELYQIMLEMEGYRVQGVFSGSECLTAITHNKPDLILLDIMMKPMDGWSTLERIREDPENNRIRVIMLTAKQPTPEEAERYTPLIDGYIMKPVDHKQLTGRVRQSFETDETVHAKAKHACDSGIPRTFVEEYCHLTRVVKAQEAFCSLLEPIYGSEGVCITSPEAARLKVLEEILKQSVELQPSAE